MANRPSTKKIDPTPAMCRAARGLLAMSQTELARAAGIGLSTVQDFELERRQVGADKIQAMGAALEAAGVRFCPDGVAKKKTP